VCGIFACNQENCNSFRKNIKEFLSVVGLSFIETRCPGLHLHVVFCCIFSASDCILYVLTFSCFQLHNRNNSKKTGGTDSKFFTTNRKGENHELREELRNPQRDRKKDAVKKVKYLYLYRSVSNGLSLDKFLFRFGV
jgi:hypothetical protein